MATGAAALYLYTAVSQLLRLEKREESLSKAILIPALLALVMHGFVIYAGSSSLSASVGFYKVASITFWLMGLLSVLIVIARPLQTLLIAIFPLAAISLLVATLTPETSRPMTENTARAVAAHINVNYCLRAVWFSHASRSFSPPAKSIIAPAQNTRAHTQTAAARCHRATHVRTHRDWYHHIKCLYIRWRLLRPRPFRSAPDTQNGAHNHCLGRL